MVTGANGQLGSALRLWAEINEDIAIFKFTDRRELDISNAEEVQNLVSKFQPTYLINTAAFTQVDKAEDESELAYQINTYSLKTLAEISQKYDCRLIHISSDYIYHSFENTPLKEESPKSPQGVYARSKYLGEKIIQKNSNRYSIFRTSWVFHETNSNFVKTMIRLGNEKDELSVVSDQIGTPTYAGHLAEAIMYFIQKIENGNISDVKANGIFNFSNEGVCSWYDFALEIFESIGLKTKVTPIASIEFPTAASRPPFSVLDKSKFKSLTGYEIPHWKVGLKLCLKKLENG